MHRIVVLLVLVWLVRPPSADAQDQVAFAQQRYLQAVEIYNSGDYARALDEFRSSLTLYSSPNSRLFVARCLRRLGRLDEAITEYDRTIYEARDRAAEDPRYETTRENAATELIAIEPLVGRLVLRMREGSTQSQVFVSGRAIPAAALGLPLPVMPGTATVRVETDGRVIFQRDVVIRSGEHATVDLFDAPQPAAMPSIRATRPTPHPAHRQSTAGPSALPWVFAGIGAAGFATAGISWLIASQQLQSLQTACGSGPCPDASHNGVVDAGETLQAVTNVAWVVGIAGAVVGTVLFIVTAAVPRATRRNAAAALQLMGGRF